MVLLEHTYPSALLQLCQADPSSLTQATNCLSILWDPTEDEI